MKWFLILVAALSLLAAAIIARADEGESDPLSGYNHKMFESNDKFDAYVLTPVAKGWEKVTPLRVRTSVSNFFGNLRFPIYTVNDFLQGKPNDGCSDIARFAINTTVGVAGFFDPATGWGIVKHDVDFGQTLGVWGVPTGPYIVLPLLGPSDLRDTGGLVVDSVLAVTPFFGDGFILIGARVVTTVNERSLVQAQVENAKLSTVDYYAAVRSAYLQHRRAMVHGTDTTEEKQQLYYPAP